MKRIPGNRDYATFIDCIRSLREEKNHTEKAVAEALGISQPAYCGKENGNFHFKIFELFLLAVHFDVCIMELFEKNVSEENFEKYMDKKGYVHKEAYLKKIKKLQLQNKKTRTEYFEMRNEVLKLKKDKEFLQGLLYNLCKNTRKKIEEN